MSGTYIRAHDGQRHRYEGEIHWQLCAHDGTATTRARRGAAAARAALARPPEESTAHAAH